MSVRPPTRDACVVIVLVAAVACGGVDRAHVASAIPASQQSPAKFDESRAAAQAVPRWCPEIEKKTETIRLPDNHDCVLGFKALAIGDVGARTSQELTSCSRQTALGKYGLAVLAGRVEGVAVLRAQMLDLLADPTVATCRWCTVLAERDLGTSLIKDAPVDTAAGHRRLRNACVSSLSAPILLFFRGKDPCSLLPSNDELFDLGRINSMMYIDMLRQCGITNFLSSLIDWSVVEMAYE